MDDQKFLQSNNVLKCIYFGFKLLGLTQKRERKFNVRTFSACLLVCVLCVYFFATIVRLQLRDGNYNWLFLFHVSRLVLVLYLLVQSLLHRGNLVRLCFQLMHSLNRMFLVGEFRILNVVSVVLFPFHFVFFVISAIELSDPRNLDNEPDHLSLKQYPLTRYVLLFLFHFMFSVGLVIGYLYQVLVTMTVECVRMNLNRLAETMATGEPVDKLAQDHSCLYATVFEFNRDINNFVLFWLIDWVACFCVKLAAEVTYNNRLLTYLVNVPPLLSVLVMLFTFTLICDSRGSLLAACRGRSKTVDTTDPTSLANETYLWCKINTAHMEFTFWKTVVIDKGFLDTLIGAAVTYLLFVLTTITTKNNDNNACFSNETNNGNYLVEATILNLVPSYLFCSYLVPAFGCST